MMVFVCLCCDWLFPSTKVVTPVSVLPFLPSTDKDVHRLVFISVSHAHGGVYKSVIANKMGKATCYAHLYVTGKDL